MVRVPVGKTILEAARSLDIYIPTLCHHPDLPPAKGGQAAPFVFQGDRKIVNASPGKPAEGCGICVVEVTGYEGLVGACATQVAEAMEVVTHSERIKAVRQEKLLPIMVRHRHACLRCAQQEGCPRSQCSASVPENERCCSRFGHCELQNIAGYVGLLDSTPRWTPTDLPVIEDHPLFTIDFNLCIGCTRCVRACRDLRGIEAIGFVTDETGQVHIGTLAATLTASGCKFCTACVAVCPTGALVDKAVEAASREEDIVPCKAACPAHIDIPDYLRLIAQGKADEAHAVIREKVALPGVLGRVCSRPCEQACRRSEVNEPIAICALKRYAADVQKGLWKNQSKVKNDTGKAVAVIGAGPAGLTASFYLRKQGHAVSLFESSRQAGGMLRYGIPAYRLPRRVLDFEIKEILDLGIDFRPNQSLGRDFSLDQLKLDGFDAVFISIGARQSRRMPLEGCQTPDTLWGMEFLRRVAEGEAVKLKDRVVVIGGGNIAVDAALTALRCGATDVKMACLESLDEIPANLRDIAGAEAEGVQILPSRGPAKIISEDGHATSLDLVACTRVFDDRGNFCPEFSDKKECILVDQVIIAVGQASDLSFLDGNSPIKVNRGLIVVDEDTLATGMPGVYAGGDITRAPGAVIWAVAAGRRAAESIDSALGGNGDIDEVLFARGNPDPYLGRDEGFAARTRQAMPELDVESRIKGFQEIATGYSDIQAVKEAKRCLQCDLRLQIGCNPCPPRAWQPFDEAHVSEVPESEGVFQLLDADYNVVAIKGTSNLRQDLVLALDENENATRFEFEENRLFSQRESELIQKYLQEHGEMPGSGADDLDDLF
jgi:NADPH-dependent glutamate synthase beta subunit-like oxidoreductase